MSMLCSPGGGGGFQMSMLCRGLRSRKGRQYQQFCTAFKIPKALQMSQVIFSLRTLERQGMCTGLVLNVDDLAMPLKATVYRSVLCRSLMSHKL